MWNEEISFESREDVFCQKVHIHYVILDPVSALSHELNETAHFIWNNYNTAKTIEEVSKLLSTEFEVQECFATADTREITNQLLSLNLIRIEQ